MVEEQGTDPLAGVTVWELGDDVSAGFAARTLGCLGASVTKYATPSHRPAAGGPLLPGGGSALEAYLDDGKTLATTTPPEDVVPDVVIWGGLDAPASVDSLADRGAIVAQVTPWGEVGAGRDAPAGELLLQAAAGVLSLVGEADRSPLMLGGRQGAYSAALETVTGILVALHHRDRTGVAQRVATSQIEALAALEWKGPVYYQADGKHLQRGNSGGPTVLPVSDGHVAFYYRPSDWPAVLELFGDDALADDRFATPGGRSRHSAELRGILSRSSVRFTKDELYRAAQARDIPVGAVSTVDDLLTSPQYAALEFFEPSSAGAGAVQPTLPFTFDGRRFGAHAKGTHR